MEVLIGLIVSFLWFLIFVVVKATLGYFRCKKYKAVFGDDVDIEGEYHGIYAQLYLMPIFNNNGIQIQKPYYKPDPNNPNIGGVFSIDRPVSGCEVRALKYLSESVGKETNKSVVVSSDDDLKNKLDVSYVSFGGPLSNMKTKEVVESADNKLIGFDNQKFYDVITKKNILEMEQGYDYGLILKVKPKNFDRRVWIACAGWGEWGTSGSAWYLSKKWLEIYKQVNDDEFAIIIKVKPGQDESAESIISVKDTQEIQDLLLSL